MKQTKEIVERKKELSKFHIVLLEKYSTEHNLKMADIDGRKCECLWSVCCS